MHQFVSIKNIILRRYQSTVVLPNVPLGSVPAGVLRRSCLCSGLLLEKTNLMPMVESRVLSCSIEEWYGSVSVASGFCFPVVAPEDLLGETSLRLPRIADFLQFSINLDVYPSFKKSSLMRDSSSSMNCLSQYLYALRNRFLITEVFWKRGW